MQLLNAKANLAAVRSAARPAAPRAPFSGRRAVVAAPAGAPAAAPAVAARGASVAAKATRSYMQQLSIGGESHQAIEVYPSEAHVSARLCVIVEEAAKAAIAANGVFTLAVPGGSVLKALAGLTAKKVDWSKTHVFYVNHKAVALTDADSTHKKAKEIFLDKVGAPAANVYPPKGSGDAKADAAAYAETVNAAATKLKMARNSTGVPRFDLLLLGVGSDGHVGSLYPGRPETLATNGYVLSVQKSASAGSISMSMPVMNAAKSVVVCLTGASKAATVRQALESPVPAGDLPVQLVKPDVAHWLLDAGAASDLALAKSVSTMTSSDVQVVKAYNAALGALPSATSSDPLENFCLSNPDADECRVYED